MRTTRWIALLLAGLVGFSVGFLAEPAVAGAQVVNRNGTRLAIGGYDPVAYHTDGRPVRGSAEHSHRWGGATWHFASAEHLALFRESPGRYAPAFGGYCAYAMADGRAVRIDPNAWSIVNGRLYLNYDLATRRRWNADRANYIRRASENWPRVRETLR
ncbi:MAG: YHS domain-containing (seleno)protein [Sandaracinaceae bacterium]